MLEHAIAAIGGLKVPRLAIGRQGKRQHVHYRSHLVYTITDQPPDFLTRVVGNRDDSCSALVQNFESHDLPANIKVTAQPPFLSLTVVNRLPQQVSLLWRPPILPDRPQECHASCGRPALSASRLSDQTHPTRLRLYRALSASISLGMYAYHEDQLPPSPIVRDMDLCAFVDRLLNDHIFEFVIGNEEVSFKVHHTAITALSEPLKCLMTNDKMEESLNKKAFIRDHEPETFAAFVKFAYLGLCGMADDYSDAGSTSPLTVPLNGALKVGRYRCAYCAQSINASGHNYYPFCSTCSPYRTRAGYNLSCVVEGCSTNGVNPVASKELLCPTHKGTPIGNQYPLLREPSDPYTYPPGASALAKRKYSCKGLSHEELSDHLQRHRPKLHNAGQTDEDVEPLLLPHAKLYALAHKYMVKDLQDICLHKLHRALTTYKVKDGSIDEVIDLVSYTYVHTSEEGDILKGNADRLRDLVMAFVKDKTKELMKYEGFRFMLGAGGPQTADFFAITFG